MNNGLSSGVLESQSWVSNILERVPVGRIVSCIAY